MSSIRVTRVALAESDEARRRAEARRAEASEARRGSAAHRARALVQSAAPTAPAIADEAGELAAALDGLAGRGIGGEQRIVELAARVSRLEQQYEVRMRLRGDATRQEIASAGRARTGAVVLDHRVRVDEEWAPDDEAPVLVTAGPVEVGGGFDAQECGAHLVEILGRAIEPLPTDDVEALVAAVQRVATAAQAEDLYARARQLVDDTDESVIERRRAVEEARALAVDLNAQLGDIDLPGADAIRAELDRVLDGELDRLPATIVGEVAALVEAEGAQRWRAVLEGLGYEFEDERGDAGYAHAAGTAAEVRLRATFSDAGTVFAPVVAPDSTGLSNEVELAVDAQNCALADRAENEAAMQGLVIERVVDRGPGHLPPDVDAAAAAVPTAGRVRQERSEGRRTRRRTSSRKQQRQ